MKLFRSLRAQVSGLLVLAMLAVVLVANGASFFLVGPPGPPPDAAVDLAARLAFTADLAARLPDIKEAGGRDRSIRPDPPEGRLEPEATRRLAEAMARIGARYEVRVILPEGGGLPVVALALPGRRWLVERGGMMPVFGPGPGPGPASPRFTLGIATWIALMGAGTTLAVVLSVRRLMKPLALIEEAAARIGPDGEPPVLPEEGPAEVRAAAAAINRLSARLKGAMDSRMRIVAGAAHDLRTPLTRMRLRAEFIADEEERVQWLADLAELDRIADSAIRLVREEVEGAPEEQVRLDRLARAVVDEAREMGLPARLVAAEGALVSGRPLSLRRAVRNLVVNAATHGAGARVAVQRAGDLAVLAIEDDGPGIPDALMGQVFEPFFRVDPARQARIGGAGLGLAIAHEIVTRHHGRLTLTNRPGGGLLQRVELPLAGTDEA
ncbi:ATP-binding protein [Xanthobacter pseudotagetidis]|uniref:ATP-binding protein n=1 Tax=Xanthobacter pseudotagetidis TaxID=3119911 RepID=UPI00372650AC